MSRPTKSEAVAALFRSSFPPFHGFAYRELHGEVLRGNLATELIAEHCEEVARGRTRRLMINVQPRALKSEIASVALPAFVIGRDPTKQILIIAGSQKLAAELMSKVMKLVGGSRYRSLFPAADLRSKGATSLRSRQGGSITCAVVGQQLSGRGADLIIADDPLSPQFAKDKGRRNAVNSWYDAEVRTRLNNRSDGAIIIVMQRVHPDDLCGHLLETQSEEYEVLALPAITRTKEDIRFPSGRVYTREAYEVLDPERDSAEQLEARLDEIGGFNFIGQYLQGDFAPWDENEVRSEYLFSKRPKNWRPGDPLAWSALFALDMRDDIKAAYFGGYSIYEDYQQDRWGTMEELQASIVEQQRRSVELANSTGPLPKRKLTPRERKLMQHAMRGMKEMQARKAVVWAPL
ncbi:hypothetical protein [Tianweitania sediminis]|uniref:Terminase large subunit gp17-like C-terminal domain-containing protein n=1 Tax=Tianweitania sediminis TaxID=1502156 RepID=A0A8J7R417_9HYPH|nr:hypothetical protein [Tianweitania sediminis]MBP0441377.1 hypothetical protein [Tianweitania sediminis]